MNQAQEGVGVWKWDSNSKADETSINLFLLFNPAENTFKKSRVSVNKELLRGTAGVNNKLLTGTIPANNLFLQIS